MERTIGLAINDPSLLGPLVENHRELFDVTDGISDPAWGLGFQQGRELLVKKRPAGFGRDVPSAIIGAEARQQIAHACPWGSRPFRGELMQPFRYRSWLFGMSGTSCVTGAMREQLADRLHAFTTPTAWHEASAEVVMLVYMRALHLAGELDHVSVSSDRCFEAMREGTKVLAEAVGEPGQLDAAVALHGHDRLYVLALGRSLSLVSFEGLGDAGSRTGGFRGSGSHLHAVLVTDRPGEHEHATLGPWQGVELVGDASSRVFDL